MKILIYDLEIINAIPPKGPARLEGIKYCAGWHDHENMGISVLVAHDGIRPRVFCADNKDAFWNLAADADLLVSFNGLAFDNRVLALSDWGMLMPPEKCYDILVETWIAAGLSPTFQYPSHIGYSLDALCAATFGAHKTGSGAMAPVLWQQGSIGEVIDYCLNDVHITRKLFKHILAGRDVIGPQGALKLRIPQYTVELGPAGKTEYKCDDGITYWR